MWTRAGHTRIGRSAVGSRWSGGTARVLEEELRGRLLYGDRPGGVGVHGLRDASREQPGSYGERGLVDDLSGAGCHHGRAEQPSAAEAAENSSWAGDELHEALGALFDDRPVEFGHG